jgi:hypothetical protein
MWQLRDGGCDAKPGSSDFPIAFTLRYRYYIFPAEMDSSSFLTSVALNSHRYRY